MKSGDACNGRSYEDETRLDALGTSAIIRQIVSQITEYQYQSSNNLNPKKSINYQRKSQSRKCRNYQYHHKDFRDKTHEVREVSPEAPEAN